MVPLSNAVVSVLSALPRKEDNPWVIAGKKPGAHLTDIQEPWRRIRSPAELDDVRIHDLRHSCAAQHSNTLYSLSILFHRKIGNQIVTGVNAILGDACAAWSAIARFSNLGCKYPFGARGMSAEKVRAERSQGRRFPRDCIIPVATACVPPPGPERLPCKRRPVTRQLDAILERRLAQREQLAEEARVCVFPSHASASSHRKSIKHLHARIGEELNALGDLSRPVLVERWTAAYLLRIPKGT